MVKIKLDIKDSFVSNRNLLGLGHNNMIDHDGKVCVVLWRLLNTVGVVINSREMSWLLGKNNTNTLLENFQYYWKRCHHLCIAFWVLQRNIELYISSIILKLSHHTMKYLPHYQWYPSTVLKTPLYQFYPVTEPNIKTVLTEVILL